MSDRRLLIVEDDGVFARTLARSFERRGYATAISAGDGGLEALAAAFAPTHAVVDLRLGSASGLGAVQVLHGRDPTTRIVMLTGFGSIATAVEAIKLGATNYLTKPADTDEIEAAFADVSVAPLPEAAVPPTLREFEWEHIHQVLAAVGGNVSEAARRLGMHRRTLARKLQKRR